MQSDVTVILITIILDILLIELVPFELIVYLRQHAEFFLVIFSLTP